jgi:ubiquinone/menaquinone biosynthesis C-methylase UbiE
MPTDNTPDPFSMVPYYAARAPEYDRIYQKPERQADIAAVREMVHVLFAGKRVLEVACGTGFWTQFIAPVAQSVVALDATPETMAIAQQRVAGAAVRFIAGDAYALPRDQGPFDAAFAGFWFSHVPMARQRGFLSGLAAALEPGARVVMLDNRYVPGSSTPIAETDAHGDSYQLRPLDDGSTHRVLKNFPTEERLRGVLVGLAHDIVLTELPHFWVLQFSVAESPR